MTFLCFECGKIWDENNFYKKVKNKCKYCLNKKLKCQECGKFVTKNGLTSQIEREHAGLKNSLHCKPSQNESNSNKLQKPKIDIVNNNKRTHLVGPSFSGKPYLKLKILSRLSNRYIYIITKSLPEKYSNSKIKTKEIGEETKRLNEYKNAIIVSDDFWASQIADI